jgi:NADH dehydrogenase (ubiquinone) 1 alpha/beta subcomplex 1
MSFLRLATRSIAHPRYALTFPRLQDRLPFRAGFSAAAALSRDVIETRVLDVLKGFEKIDPLKVKACRLYHYIVDNISTLAIDQVVVRE